jgi:ferredoxin
MSRAIHLVYFSPTGNVRRTLLAISEGAGCEAVEHDLTPFDARWAKYSFGPEDFAIIGMPVYGGSIPANAVEMFRCLSAENTQCACVLSYGGFGYGESLVELRDRCIKKGFAPVGAAVFVGEGAFSSASTAGRPDPADLDAMREFGRSLASKWRAGGERKELGIEGSRDRTRLEPPSLGPKTGAACNSCGECARACPMAAINPADPAEVDSCRCIKCYRCVRLCPRKAKFMEDEDFERLASSLGSRNDARKEAELFL